MYIYPDIYIYIYITIFRELEHPLLAGDPLSAGGKGHAYGLRGKG